MVSKFDLSIFGVDEITDDNFEDVVIKCRDVLSGAEIVSDEMLGASFAVLGFAANKLYKDFTRAFHVIEHDNPFAEKAFKALVMICERLIAIMNCMIGKCLDSGRIAELLAAAHCILDCGNSSAHNLFVMAYNKNLRDDRAMWCKKGEAICAEILFYKALNKLYYSGELADKLFKNIKLYTVFNTWQVLGVAELRLFALAVERRGDTLARYLKSVYGKEEKHWYNVYKRLTDANDEKVAAHMQTVGRYLCDTADELASKRIMYHSIFFESVALEYAYKNKLYAVADKILDNGYDYYLEPSTLFIINTYDRERYLKEIKMLKVICLKRNMRLVQPNDYRYMHFRQIYGDEFCDDLITHATAALAEIDTSDMNDPRNVESRNIPDWAK